MTDRNPSSWQHIANEYADTTANAVQWLRNIIDGISTPEQALADLNASVARITAIPNPEPVVGVVYTKAPAVNENLRNLRAIRDTVLTGEVRADMRKDMDRAIESYTTCAKLAADSAPSIDYLPLPDLPIPSDGGRYTSADMHKYARKAIALRAKAAEEPFGYVARDTLNHFHSHRLNDNSLGQRTLFSKSFGLACIPVWLKPDHTAEAEAILRETLQERKMRTDGDLLALADRCRNMSREDRDCIAIRGRLIDSFSAEVAELRGEDKV